MAKRLRNTATPARLLALEVTREVRQRDAYVREILNTRRETCDLPEQEFDFAQVLAIGAIMCAGTLDEAIDRNLRKPSDIKPNVRDALRISAYELIFLEKPSHVAVSQGVELVRSVAPAAAGLANAVLRKLAADAARFPWGDPAHDDAAFARLYGVPSWLAERLIAELGRKAAAEVLAACLHPAPRYLVENPFDPDKPFASDLAAQQVAGIVPLEGTILEIGAGRGTKTMLLESRALAELGHIVPIHAVDLHEYRARLHAERMQQAGIDDVRSYAGDARELDAIEGLLDAYETVFIDAPCSGTGTMRRHPEIRWHLSADDVRDLSALQHELLQEAARRVQQGGHLVYATCSILHEENQDVVDAFLRDATAGEWTVERTFATLPEENGPDGHFAVLMRRS